VAAWACVRLAARAGAHVRMQAHAGAARRGRGGGAGLVCGANKNPGQGRFTICPGLWGFRVWELCVLFQVRQGVDAVLVAIGVGAGGG